MAQYINKEALIVKIANLKHKVDDSYSYSSGWKDALRMLESDLSTLEVKEVDFEKELDKIWFDNIPVNFANMKEVCKHFFELGLKSQKGE